MKIGRTIAEKDTASKNRVDYYPFGLEMAHSWEQLPNAVANAYRYNAGSEKNNLTGNYETLFRQYDPAIGRMLAVDPVAVKYSSMTPYNYAFNDPVFWNDPTGADPDWNYTGDYIDQYENDIIYRDHGPAYVEGHGGPALSMLNGISAMMNGGNVYHGERGAGLIDWSYANVNFNTISINWASLKDGVHMFSGDEYTYWDDATFEQNYEAFGHDLIASMLGADISPITSSYAGGARLWGDRGGTVFVTDPSQRVTVVTGTASPAHAAPDSWVPVVGDIERAVYWAGYDDWSRVGVYSLSALTDLAGLGALGKAAVKAVGKVAVREVAQSATKKANTGRVFWSGGGNEAVEAQARQFALKNNLTTLEMTRAGQNLTNLTRGMPRVQSGPMWDRLSAQFARGATGNVHVFHNTGGIRVGGTWGRVEYKIIKQKNLNIVYHNVD